MTLPLTPPALGQRLRDGLPSLTTDVLQTVSTILPSGIYEGGLLTVRPSPPQSVESPTRQPSFIWPCPPHMVDDLPLHEQIFPLTTHPLNTATLLAYETAMAHGEHPTALALSIIDMRLHYTGQRYWQLVHFLLDGHHKMMAASQQHHPITLLSLVNTSESYASPTICRQTFQARYSRPRYPSIRTRL